jgi:hypothetical protein
MNVLSFADEAQARFEEIRRQCPRLKTMDLRKFRASGEGGRVSPGASPAVRIRLDIAHRSCFGGPAGRTGTDQDAGPGMSFRSSLNRPKVRNRNLRMFGVGPCRHLSFPSQA